LFCFFRAYQSRFRCRVSWSVSAFPSQMKMTFCRQSQEVHKGKDTEQTPQSKVSKIIIALTIFFHSLIISHLNSRFPHELKAIFYGNYLVPALVNNVYPQIVNDTKTEHRSDFPYPNDLPQEVDRWVAKCICCNLQFVNTLTDSIAYADTDLNPNVHVILKLLLTLPVSSCACERSFTALRCLKTWCRASNID
jgi:hypothetical protein